MSPAEDRFIAGEGPLAALVRAQPAFEPPPQMLERVLAALDAAPAPAGFEPPTSLFDAVMAEADRLDAAQAPRREALLAELAAGKTANDTLGAPVSPATAEWLARQRPAPATAPTRPRRRWPWLAGISTALTAALAVSVALRMVQEPAPPPEMLAMPATAPAESAMDTLRQSPAGASAEATAGTARSADNTLARAARPPLAERLAKAEAPPASPARSREMARPDAEAKRAAPRPAPPTPAQEEPAPAAPAAAPPMLAKALRAPAPSAPPAAEADAAITAAAPIDAPLDTPAATLAARLLARPAQAWTLHVAPADAAAGRALQADLLAQLQAAGREDPITLAEHPLPRGQLRLSPTR